MRRLAISVFLFICVHTFSIAADDKEFGVVEPKSIPNFDRVSTFAKWLDESVKVGKMTKLSANITNLNLNEIILELPASLEQLTLNCQNTKVGNGVFKAHGLSKSQKITFENCDFLGATVEGYNTEIHIMKSKGVLTTSVMGNKDNSKISFFMKNSHMSNLNFTEYISSFVSEQSFVNHMSFKRIAKSIFVNSYLEMIDDGFIGWYDRIYAINSFINAPNTEMDSYDGNALFIGSMGNFKGYIGFLFNSYVKANKTGRIWHLENSYLPQIKKDSINQLVGAEYDNLVLGEQKDGSPLGQMGAPIDKAKQKFSEKLQYIGIEYSKYIDYDINGKKRDPLKPSVGPWEVVWIGKDIGIDSGGEIVGFDKNGSKN